MCHKAISELVNDDSNDMAHAGSKTTSDTLKLSHWLKIENHTSFTMSCGSREKKEPKYFQVISSLYTFPMQTTHSTPDKLR